MSSHAEKELARLSSYLLAHWHEEIGAGNRVHGETAVDVAIRLLRRLEKIEAEN